MDRYILIIMCLFYKLQAKKQQTFLQRDQSKIILNLVVCILLCVLDQVQGFPSNATLFQ
jgi:hypothetical protein